MNYKFMQQVYLLKNVRALNLLNFCLLFFYFNIFYCYSAVILPFLFIFKLLTYHNFILIYIPFAISVACINKMKVTLFMVIKI